MEQRTWIALVNRLLKAKLRADPKKPGGTAKYWTQGDLALAAGVRPNTLSSMMQAESDPSLDTIGKIAKALDVPAFYLLMTEDQARAYERGIQQSQQEDVAASVKAELREFLMSRMDGALDKLTAEFQQQQTKTEAPAQEPRPAAARKRA